MRKRLLTDGASADDTAFVCERALAASHMRHFLALARSELDARVRQVAAEASATGARFKAVSTRDTSSVRPSMNRMLIREHSNFNFDISRMGAS